MKDAFVQGSVLDGRYEAVSPLNHGSFGMVFLARDIGSGEHVAIKCLTKPATASDASTLKEDIKVELKCHERLGNHSNLVNLLHYFETVSHLYLVLEFCSMGDLYEAIRLGRGPLQTENVREFMHQLIGAVEHMHARGLYHRDIKPENIFLSQEGHVKLGDFGLVTSDAWSYEASVGSDRYMAPEQYEPGETGYSPAKADVWAIGICLLNVLFSRNPFVTPTESDVLFSDYVRDHQSLFDIFPNMSQDTFNVLSHALAIDPTKRSLSALRSSLDKVISFTTDEEVLDDFCNNECQPVPASANREPLRTPSIQSPHVDQGSFPWAKALHTSPQKPTRQLSAIPDTESYTEDLFPPSENRDSWYSLAGQSSSVATDLDFTFGTSVKSMVLHPPAPRIIDRTRPVDVPVPSSLPARPKMPMPTMSTVFGNKKATVSKSWSDLWDEEEEGELVEHEDAIEESHDAKSRTWSLDSKVDEPTLRPRGLSELKDQAVNSRTSSPHASRVTTIKDMEPENDHFMFEEITPMPTSPRYSPPSKRNTILDKWAALGNRRRAYQQDKSDPLATPKKRQNLGNWRDGLGLKALSGNMMGRYRKESVDGKVYDWRRDTKDGSVTQLQNDSMSDLEWVGGWKDSHR